MKKLTRWTLFFLITSMMSHAAETWRTDYQAALKEAAKDKKQVLLDFTGSDWCGWCQRLKGELFDKEEFKKYAEKNLVLVEVDFPQSKELPASLQAQNKELEAKYHVNGFPTLVLLDSQGNLIKQKNGYLEGGPTAFVTWVESGPKRTDMAPATVD